MNYDLTPEGYRLLRHLMHDIRALLAEFKDDGELGHLGYRSVTVMASDVNDLMVRCKNMITLPVAVEPKSVPDEQRAAPTLPFPALPLDLAKRAREAEAEYNQFVAPLATKDGNYDIVSVLKETADEGLTSTGKALISTQSAAPPTSAAKDYISSMRCECDLRNRQWNFRGTCLACGCRYEDKR